MWSAIDLQCTSCSRRREPPGVLHVVGAAARAGGALPAQRVEPTCGRACEHSGVSWRVSAPGRPWPAEVLQLVTPEREYLLAVGDTAILLPPLSTFNRCFNGG